MGPSKLQEMTGGPGCLRTKEHVLQQSPRTCREPQWCLDDLDDQATTPDEKSHGFHGQFGGKIVISLLL